MPGLKLKLRATGLHGKDCRVWLNDQEFTRCLTGVTVSFDVADATTAELRVLVDDLDLDAPTLAILAAHVRDEDGDKPTAPHPTCVEITSQLDTERRYVCGADCPAA